MVYTVEELYKTAQEMGLLESVGAVIRKINAEREAEVAKLQQKFLANDAVLTFGKYRGKKLSEVVDLKWLQWVASDNFQPTQWEAMDIKAKVQAVLSE